MVSRSGATVAWSTYNYPLTINQAGGNTSTFYYGAERNRYRQISTDGGVTEDRITVAGGTFEQLTRGSTIEYRHFVQVSGKAVAIVKRSAQTGNITYYLHEDHLGSTDVIANDDPMPANRIVVRTSFDAWGLRRGSNWSGTPSAADKAAISATTHQGYTGQEQLDNLSLVHMNGRVYDPAIGRFMSADPTVQDPYHSQAYNRYSYVWNNPLNATDPTGFDCVGASHIDTADGSICRNSIKGEQSGIAQAGVSDNGAHAGSHTTARSAPSDASSGSNSSQGGSDQTQRERTKAEQNGAPQGDAGRIGPAWASQKGFFVHQRATYLVIGSHLSKRENQILADAQVYSDSDEFQDAASAFRHAMRNDHQSIEEAQDDANKFVRQQFQYAWSAPTREDALFAFGVALHTLQDSTSPAHAGFQVWTGHETFGQQLEHVQQELRDPGPGSALHQATGTAWQWFQQGRLPDGNLFIFGHD